jgi:hypothetical protein
MAKFTIHESVTAERVIQLVEQYHSSLDNPGICLACGEDAMDCEPDAERYECEYCEKRAVYGAEQILMCGYHHP